MAANGKSRHFLLQFGTIKKHPRYLGLIGNVSPRVEPRKTDLNNRNDANVSVPNVMRHVCSENLMPQSSSAARKGPEKISGAAAIAIALHVNGEERKLKVAPWTTLLDALRDRLNLTGTKKGCDHGQCGACTVLIEGRRVNSCLTLAVMKDGANITTIEGLAKNGALHPLQQAFIDHDAFQCGYCTPGQICSSAGLIAEGKAKTVDEIRELMSGNICRCGAYPNIVAAIQQAMTAMGGKP
jgi:xanthine dehydrogenase YagT iron-sulfur-binding subunit